MRLKEKEPVNVSDILQNQENLFYSLIVGDLKVESETRKQRDHKKETKTHDSKSRRRMRARNTINHLYNLIDKNNTRGTNE